MRTALHMWVSWPMAGTVLFAPRRVIQHDEAMFDFLVSLLAFGLVHFPAFRYIYIDISIMFSLFGPDEYDEF